MFIQAINLYFRIYNLPYSNGQQTNIYRLDVLHHPKAPCHSHEVVLNVFDTTDSPIKISRGSGHSYLTFLLHKERTYEIVDGQGFSKHISWVSQPVCVVFLCPTFYQHQFPFELGTCRS
jgi:hypothetical protein